MTLSSPRVNHDANSLTKHPSYYHHDRTGISQRTHKEPLDHHRTITDVFLMSKRAAYYYGSVALCVMKIRRVV
jgi:hypothetical protein